MDLPARIVSIRKQMGLSQEKFGEMLNMSQRSVAAWEAGERTPSFATLSDLADKLNVSVDYLLGRTDERKSSKKEKPAVQDGELVADIIARIQALPNEALFRVSDFLDGLQAGQAVAEVGAAAPGSADTLDE